MPVLQSDAVRPRAGVLRLLAVGAAAMLAGCGAVSSVMPFSSSRAASKTIACPTTTILRPLANTAVFGPAATVPRKSIDVAFYGLLSEVEATCEAAGPDGLRASLNIIIAGERGPSAKADAVDLTYFIAVTGPNEAVLSKKNLAVHIEIPPNAKRAAVADHLDEAIALGGRNPAEVSILIGFQQPPDVVDFYKNYRGR